MTITATYGNFCCLIVSYLICIFTYNDVSIYTMSDGLANFVKPDSSFDAHFGIMMRPLLFSFDNNLLIRNDEKLIALNRLVFDCRVNKVFRYRI